MTCPACSEPIQPLARFCPECGVALAAASKPQAGSARHTESAFSQRPSATSEVDPRSSYSLRRLGESQRLFTLSGLARGDYGLARTFWLYGVLVRLGSSLVLRLVEGTVLGVLFGVTYLGYEVALTMGIWRAAGRYAGGEHWVVLARALAVLPLVFLGWGLLRAVLPS